MKFYTRKRRVPTVIIVSLIDIFAILLIFVIVTTTFRRPQPQVVIKLPESKSAAPAKLMEEAEPAVLSIAENEELFLNDRPVAIADLQDALRELLVATPGRALALNADTKAPFGLIIRVLDILKESGVKNVPAFTEIKR
jgi:biopolymer transport protein ExbD